MMPASFMPLMTSCLRADDTVVLRTDDASELHAAEDVMPCADDAVVLRTDDASELHAAEDVVPCADDPVSLRADDAVKLNADEDVKLFSRRCCRASCR